MTVLSWMPTKSMVLVLLTMKISLTHAYYRNTVLWFEVGPIVRNCQDINKQGNATSGIHTIYPYHCSPDRPGQVELPI